MTRLQRWVAVGTLTLTAVFLHRVLCEWVSEEVYKHSAYNREDLVPISEERGIVARSRETYGFDAVFGIAVPMILLGGALFVLASPGNEKRERQAVNDGGSGS